MVSHTQDTVSYGCVLVRLDFVIVRDIHKFCAMCEVLVHISKLSSYCYVIMGVCGDLPVVQLKSARQVLET